MADKTLTVKDPATEILLQEIFRNIDLGNAAHDSKAGNFNAMYVQDTDTGVANTEFTVAHKLDRVPVAYITGYISKAGVIYDSGTTWTTTNMYLKCDAANASVTLLIW
jgi:hypothetical protein